MPSGATVPRNWPARRALINSSPSATPAVLDASGSINGQAVTRPLCPYPDPDAIYTGGDADVATSYTCSSQPRFTNPFLLNGQHGRLR